MATNDWKTIKFPALLNICQILGGAKEQGQPARLKVAQYLYDSYATVSGATTQPSAQADWLLLLQIVTTLSPDLTGEVKSTWVTRFRQTLGDNGTVGAMAPQDLMNLADSLKRLADPQVGALVSWYVAHGNAWPTTATPTQLGQLTTRIHLDKSGDAVAGRARMRQIVESNLLTDVTTVKKMIPGTWAALVGLFIDAPEKSRKLFVERLTEAYASTNELIMVMTSSVARDIATALMPIDRAAGAHVAATWLKRTSANTRGNISEWSTLVVLSLEDLSMSRTELQGLLVDLEVAVAAAAKDPLSPTDRAFFFAQSWGRAGNLEKSAAWARKFYDLIMGTDGTQKGAPLAQLFRVSEAMYYAGLATPDKSYPAFASALALMARNGQLVTDEPVGLSIMLGGDASKQMLRNELLDGNSQPRLAIGEVLAGRTTRPSSLSNGTLTWMSRSPKPTARLTPRQSGCS